MCPESIEQDKPVISELPLILLQLLLLDPQSLKSFLVTTLLQAQLQQEKASMKSQHMWVPVTIESMWITPQYLDPSKAANHELSMVKGIRWSLTIW